jgi:hypothetical protein
VYTGRGRENDPRVGMAVSNSDLFLVVKCGAAQDTGHVLLGIAVRTTPKARRDRLECERGETESASRRLWKVGAMMRTTAAALLNPARRAHPVPGWPTHKQGPVRSTDCTNCARDP